MSEVLEKIKPFDLIAFNGTGLISKGISLVEKITTGDGDFSHVGMAVRAEILPGYNLEKGKVYIFESKCKTGPGRPVDVITGEDIMGVSLRDLAAVLQVSSSRVAWCPLVENPWDDESSREGLAEKFSAFFAHYHRTSYEMDAISMTAAFLPAARPLREARDAVAHGLSGLLSAEDPSDWQFCSELVARAWQAVGILGPEVDPRNALPVDFFGCDRDKKTGMEKMVGAPAELPTHGKKSIIY